MWHSFSPPSHPPYLQTHIPVGSSSILVGWHSAQTGQSPAELSDSDNTTCLLASQPLDSASLPYSPVLLFETPPVSVLSSFGAYAVTLHLTGHLNAAVYVFSGQEDAVTCKVVPDPPDDNTLLFRCPCVAPARSCRLLVRVRTDTGLEADGRFCEVSIEPVV